MKDTDQVKPPTPPRAALAEELKELEYLFEMRWKADMRAIKRWHEAGNPELIWPDHADLVVWLLGQLELRDEGREIIEGLAYQFGFRGVKDGATILGTAGHSDLERAFAFLGWSDPQPIPEEGCEAEGCVEPATCGTPTPEGYKRLCRSHALANRSRDRGK